MYATQSRFKSTLSALAAAVILLAASPSTQAQQPAANLTPAEAEQIALDAYIYGYSLITTEVTRVQMTNVAKAEGMHAPMGQFSNIKRYPSADFRGVSAPNADTLYSLAWLDLSEPQVFSHPDMGDRYYLFEVVDLWMTDLAESPSSRTAGGDARQYLFTGPDWRGEVPKGMTHIPMATRYMVILGRTYADGTEEDYEKVNALQAQYKVTPLSGWGESYTYKAPPVNPDPGFSMTDKPQEVILGMGAEDYFNRVAELMGGAAPPADDDAPMIATIAKIGIVPGQPFEMSKLDESTQQALKGIPQQALEKIEADKNALGEIKNGWIITKGLGEYGTNYLKRAVVAAFGWPANRQKDAVYPYTEVDASGEILTGSDKYTLTFAKDQAPPVNAFWSVTMYEIDGGWWFVPNNLDKFTVSPRNDLKYNADGSLTLYFQHDSPGADKQANWLPAPEGEFIPMLRMYWPKTEDPSILNGTWTPPPVVKVD